TKDAVATTVGVLIVWPALFLIQGDKQNAAQLAQLKGQMNAIGGNVYSKELRYSVPASSRGCTAASGLQWPEIISKSPPRVAPVALALRCKIAPGPLARPASEALPVFRDIRRDPPRLVSGGARTAHWLIEAWA